MSKSIAIYALAGVLAIASFETRQASKPIQSVDITFSSDAIGGLISTPSSVKFNKCGQSEDSQEHRDEEYHAFSLAVHETGHALGLSNFSYSAFIASSVEGAITGIETDVPGDVAHPTIPDTVMNYDDMTSGPTILK